MKKFEVTRAETTEVWAENPEHAISIADFDAFACSNIEAQEIEYEVSNE